MDPYTMDITPIEVKSALVRSRIPGVDFVINRNYPGQVAGLFRRHGWAYALTADYARQTTAQLRQLLPKNEDGDS